MSSTAVLVSQDTDTGQTCVTWHMPRTEAEELARQCQTGESGRLGIVYFLVPSRAPRELTDVPAESTADADEAFSGKRRP